MSESPQFSFPRFGRTRKSQSSEFDYLLNLCPSAVIIIAAADGSVRQGNSPAAELSGYSIIEFNRLSIETLFPDWNKHPLEKTPDPYRQRTLQRKDGALVPIQIENWDTSTDQKNVIIVFSALAFALNPSGTVSGDLPGTAIKELFNGIQESELTQAFDLTLKAAKSLLNLDCLAIYMLEPDHRGYTIKSWLGLNDWLPLELAGHDAAAIHSPQIWKSNRRPTHPLHRAGHEVKRAFVAAFPIIVGSDLRGILIISDALRSPAEDLASYGLVLANILAIEIQKIDLLGKIRQLEDRLSSSLQIENTLKENIIEGCLVVSANMQIIGINAAAEQTLGYRRSQVIGQLVERVLIGTETLSAALEEIQQTGRLKMTELRLYRRSGEAFLAQIQAFPLQTGSATKEGSASPLPFQGALILFSDLTQQEAAREQTHQLEQRAMLGEVTAVFAHEVRNPINNISTGLELIELTLPEDDPNQVTITRLLQDCDRLADLMKSVLSFSRPAEYTMSILNLEPFLQNIVERMRPRLERMNIHGSVQAEPDLAPIIGSPRALEQVISNLINNAVQAMGEAGGQVILKIQNPQPVESPTGTEKSHFMEICVIDTGPGIPAEYLDRLFQPFFTTHTSGTGLGLAIAKRIITAHRGSITVNSFPGGTVFHILLPKAG